MFKHPIALSFPLFITGLIENFLKYFDLVLSIFGFLLLYLLGIDQLDNFKLLPEFLYHFTGS
jgi:hypothetical protein